MADKETDDLRRRVRRLEAVVGAALLRDALTDETETEDENEGTVRNPADAAYYFHTGSKEWDVEFHHKEDVDLDIYPAQPFRANTKKEAMAKAIKYLKEVSGEKLKDFTIIVERS